jgi:CHAD domain-containing protein
MATTATPVQQLREQAKRLEAALAVGLATPTTKAVHELRSGTRRVEAQLELLAMLRGLPRYRPVAAKVLRRLATLRRKAGRVRDCDVQCKLLDDRDLAMRSAPEAPAGLANAQEKLRERINKTRERNQRRLLAEIEDQLPKLTRDTEKLLKALKPAADETLPVDDLLARIERHLAPILSARKRGEEHLHDLRKAAKRARYQCEAMPGPAAKAMADRLEELQDAGGAWHDHLDLAELCHRVLGSEHAFSRVIEHLRDEHLDRYLADLDDFRARHTPPSRAKPHQAGRSAPANTRRKPAARAARPKASRRESSAPRKA